VLAVQQYRHASTNKSPVGSCICFRVAFVHKVPVSFFGFDKIEFVPPVDPRRDLDKQRNRSIDGGDGGYTE
jgi:hypothetical protein